MVVWIDVLCVRVQKAFRIDTTIPIVSVYCSTSTLYLYSSSSGGSRNSDRGSAGGGVIKVVHECNKVVIEAQRFHQSSGRLSVSTRQYHASLPAYICIRIYIHT